MAEEDRPHQIAGYTVFSLTLPQLPSYPVAATHYLYISPHQPRVSTPSASRSLFLVNVPFDSTTLHVRHLFSKQIGLPAGRVEGIQFKGGGGETENSPRQTSSVSQLKARGKKRKRDDREIDIDNLPGAELPPTWDRMLQAGNLTAVVVFVDRASAESALKAVKKMQKAREKPIWGRGIEDRVPPFGYARMHRRPLIIAWADSFFLFLKKGYLRHHQLTFPHKASVLRSVDSYMSAYAAKEAAEARVQARRRQEPDEDGFVTVTRGGRNNPAKQAVAQDLVEKQKEKRKGLQNFYRFQSREKRKEQAKELVRKFEEDKEKIRAMKRRRQRFMVRVGPLSCCLWSHDGSFRSSPNEGVIGLQLGQRP